jgi:transposase
MFGMAKRHSVQVLREAGHTQQDVKKQTGVSERTIRRIEDEPPVKLCVEAILKAEPELPTLEVLRRVREDGYLGGKSALYELVQSVRPKTMRPIVRFEAVAGEFTQHDFGQVDVRFLDGSVKRVHFFASRLKYSRMVGVTMVANERVEALVRALVGHYEYFGGIPLMSVFDRPKTVAIEWRKDGVVTKWNPTFMAVVGELGVGVELCWPYQPQQKGAVENLVGWVKGSFFKPRRFVDDDDLRRQLEAWHREVNYERPSRATKEIPAQRLTAERARLRPLKVTSEQLELRYPVHVGPTAMVEFDTCRYSMPPQAMGLPGTLYLGRNTVRLIAGRWEALHPRLTEPNSVSVLPEHRAAMLTVISSQRGRDYLKREHLFALGNDAVDFITELVHRRPQTWKRDVNVMHELLSLHREADVAAAISAALKAGTIGYEYVAHHLNERQRAAWMNFVGEGVAQ